VPTLPRQATALFGRCLLRFAEVWLDFSLMAQVAQAAYRSADRQMNGSSNRPATRTWWVVVTALLLSPLAASAQQTQPTHPLDALTGAELSQVKAILQAEGKIGPKARFHNVDLDEPDKAEVTAWRPGTTLPRRAIAVVTEAGTVHEAAVDLSAGRMTGWQTVTGEPALLLGEMIGAGDMALADSRMVQALVARKKRAGAS
jgi:primary-amine oxidase